MSPKIVRLPARLFWRVYLNGLVLLTLVALAVFAVGSALGRRPPGRSPERLAEYAAARAAELRRDPAALGRELRLLRDSFGIAATYYEGGQAVATSAEPPLPPLGAEEERRAGRGPARLPGRSLSFAAPVPDAPAGYVVVAFEAHGRSLLRGAALLAAVLFALALGSIPLAHAISAPLERLGAAVRRFGAGDLSARARLRSGGEVSEVAAAFDVMAERIQSLLRSEKELLANVSHELRTPLARIRVGLDLAAEGDHERSRRHLAGIAADLDELTQLVDDVLSAARLDLAAGWESGGALPLRRERIDPREVVLRSAERFRAAYPARPLEVKLEEPLPPLDADAALLRRVVENLLDNARKYSEEAAPIEIRARREGGALVVEVQDEGIGVPSGELERIFAPFFRSDRSRARQTGGVGLGLALARRIVEAHGGLISAVSSGAGGTTVRFSVPAAG